MGDWAPGDLALCIRTAITVAAGELHTVEEVLVGDMPGDPHHGHIGLRLVGKVSATDCGAYHSAGFVKVTPPEADEFDREVIELMNRHPAEAILTQDGEG